MTITPRNTTITAGNTLVKEKTRISSLFETETTPFSSRRLDYIYAEGRIVAVRVYANGSGSLYYVLTDHLGSWERVLDQSRNTIQQTHFDPWGNRMSFTAWNTPQTQTTFNFDRGFTGHEHYDSLHIINANARLYDPVIGRFFSPDPFVQAPDFTQAFNRYSYCMNNPVMYSDPDGESITAAIIIGSVILGAYSGGVLANNGNYNPAQWDWKNFNTIIGVIGGGIAGGLSSWAGIAVVGAGFSFCNTAAIATSSLAYSSGMYLTGLGAGFDYDVSMSIGFASYNFTKNEFGYLFKKGNSLLDNIGYGLGAVTNVCDIYRFATWDVLTKQQRFDKLQRWASKNHGENNMTYNPNMDKVGTYNLQTDEIQISNHALSEDFGWAKSTYLHEKNHRLIMPPNKDRINQLLQLEKMGVPGATEALKQYYAAFDSFAYETELINAAATGLSSNQFQRINNLYIYYSSIGQRIGGNYNYSLWDLLKNLVLP